MFPIFIFIYLGFCQIAIAVIGCIIAFVITIPPNLRTARGKAIWASLLGATGGFVGVIIVYVSIMVVGLAWKALELLHLVGPAIILAVVAPWVLIAGYIVGLVGGSYVGWKIR